MEENKLQEALQGYEIQIIEDDRSLDILGEFNEDMLSMVYDFVSKLDKESNEPIVLNISSRGGDADTLFAIIDLLKNLKVELHGRVNGFAYSSALGLFCACDKREMGDNALIMYHTCSFGYEGNIEDHNNNIIEAKKLQQKYDELVMKASNLQKKDLKKYKQKDFYMDKEAATKFGILNV